MSWLPVSLAKRRKAPMGSDPVERTKTRGVTLFMSSYSSCKWTAGLSTNGWPRFSRTKSVTANTVCGQNGRYLLYETNILTHKVRQTQTQSVDRMADTCYTKLTSFSRTKSVSRNTVCGQIGRHLLYETNIISRTKSVSRNTVCEQNGRHLLYKINVVSRTKTSFSFFLLCLL